MWRGYFYPKSVVAKLQLRDLKLYLEMKEYATW